MQISQNWRDVITFPGTREHSHQRVDHSLNLAEVSSGRSIKDRVTIVEPCTDHQASHCPCSFIVDAPPDMTQSSNVEVSSFANIVDLAVEGQSFIKCDSKALDCFRNSNRSVAESQSTDSTLLSIPCTVHQYRLRWPLLCLDWGQGYYPRTSCGRNGSSHSASVRCHCPSALYRAGCCPRIGCDGSRKMTAQKTFSHPVSFTPGTLSRRI